MKRLSVFLAVLLVGLSLSSSVFAQESESHHYTLPVDFSPGLPVDQKNYISDTVYEDPTLKIVITTGDCDGVLYWIADIEIQDPSQLRTAAAESFRTSGSEYGSVLAKRMNAVLAVDGDYYCYSKGTAFTMRQGTLFRNEIRKRGGHDVLLIDENGDFYGLIRPKEKEVNNILENKKIIDGFCFGPVLVNNGVMNDRAPVSLDPKQCSQRVAIAQTGHLKYRVIVSGPAARGSKAFLFDEWRRFVAGMPDIQVAYNLDGGDSAVLVFNNRKINDPENTNERPLADIIYFASAWPGD